MLSDVKLVELVESAVREVRTPRSVREEAVAEALLDCCQVRVHDLTEDSVRKVARRAAFRIMKREERYGRRNLPLLDVADFRAPGPSVEDIVIWRDEIERVMRPYHELFIEAQRRYAINGDVELFYRLRDLPGHNAYPDWLAGYTDAKRFRGRLRCR